MSNLFSIIREVTPEDVTIEILAYLLKEFPVCRKTFLSLFDISTNADDCNVQTQCWFPSGRPDLVLHDENEQWYLLIENKPWGSSSFTTLNESGQMKRYAEELAKIDAQEKTLCLLATERNKDNLLQEMATEVGEDVGTDEKSLQEYYTANYGIDFITVMWQQVLESFAALKPKYPVVKFFVTELQNYLFSHNAEQLIESPMINQVVDVHTAFLELLADYIGSSPNSISTDFPDLDGILGGFHPNELIILASRPGFGKTALAMNIVDHVAMNQQEAVLVVNLEMSRHELTMRLVGSRSKINIIKYRRGLLSNAERESFLDTARELAQSRIFFDTSPSRTVAEIALAAKRLKRQYNLKLLVVDYLGLIVPDNPAETRQEQIAKIVRQLKKLARELQIPVLCLAQLNRSMEQGKEIEPKLAHIRESGAIEEVADVVLLLHRKDAGMSEDEIAEQEYNTGNNVCNQAELFVAKHRNGTTGSVSLIWRGEWTRFFSVDVHHAQDYEEFCEGDTF